MSNKTKQPEQSASIKPCAVAQTVKTGGNNKIFSPSTTDLGTDSHSVGVHGSTWGLKIE